MSFHSLSVCYVLTEQDGQGTYPISTRVTTRNIAADKLGNEFSYVPSLFFSLYRSSSHRHPLRLFSSTSSIPPNSHPIMPFHIWQRLPALRSPLGHYSCQLVQVLVWLQHWNLQLGSSALYFFYVRMSRAIGFRRWESASECMRGNGRQADDGDGDTV